MSDSVVSLTNVTKKYGSAIGVNDISFDVPTGSVFGFLGPNGAGKSTTINMLVDFIRPTSGTIKIFGLDSVKDSLEIRKRLGFLAGDFALDKSLTGWQQLEYFGSLRGNFDRKYVTELAGRLNCKLNHKFKSLSRGNKQKVGLIAALMHKPDLLVFDEPTSGLDPLIQAEFNKIIVEQKQRGATTFISSHVLSEIQEICDYVAFIREGRLIVSKPLHEIMLSSARQVELTGISISKDADIAGNKSVIDFKRHGDKVVFTFEGDPNQLVKLLSNFKLQDVSIKEPDLEAVFMKYYEASNV